MATYVGCYLLKQLNPGNLFGVVNIATLMSFSTVITGFIGMPFELTGRSLPLGGYILVDELILIGLLVWLFQ